MRRAGLARVTPLHRTTPLPRRHSGPRRHGPVVAWPALRAALWTRCGAYCEACGARLNPDWWDAHHRLPRSRGGQDDLCTLVALHGGCHTVGPQAVHQRPAWAYGRGLLIRSGGDPAVVPLTLPGGRTVVLTAAGAYQDVA